MMEKSNVLNNNFKSKPRLIKKKRTKIVHKNVSQGYYKVKLVAIRLNLKKKVFKEKFIFKYENDL